MTGGQGVPGKDAKLFKPSSCGVTRASTTQRVCCGRAQVHWSSFANQAATIDVNTQECKFEGDVQYFPNVKGNGYQWSLSSGGMTNIRNTGFTYRTTSVYYNFGPWGGWYGNVFQWTVNWCGVGKTSLKTTTSVCCESSSKNHFDYWYVGGAYKHQDTSKCGFKGSPQYHMAISAKQDTYSIYGVNNFYNGYRPWDKMFSNYVYMSPEYPWKSYTMSRQNEWRLNWCGFGETFPNGGQLVGMNKLDEANYPCKGVRMIEDNVVKSQAGEMCCGTSEAGGWKAGSSVVSDRWARSYTKAGIYKRIDTSSCGFAAEPRPVYLTTLSGEHTWSVSGGTSYTGSDETGFTTELMGWKEDAATLTTSKASNWQWQVQWCGFGVKK